MFATDPTPMALYLPTSENKNDEVTGPWHKWGEKNESKKPLQMLTRETCRQFMMTDNCPHFRELPAGYKMQ